MQDERALAVAALAERLHFKMCQLESDYEDWQALDEGERGFYLSLIEHLLTTPDLLITAMSHAR